MKFSAITVLTAIAASTSNGVSGFVNNGHLPSKNTAFSPRSPIQQSKYASGALSMAISDLEAKLLSPEPVEPAKKKAEKKEKPKKEIKEKKESKKEKAAREAAEAAKAQEIAAKKKIEVAPTGKVTYDKELTKKAPKKKVVTSTPAKINSAQSSPSFSAPKLPSLPAISLPKPPASKAPSEGDANPLLGVALGAAPLVAVPVVGLSALRSTLSRTQERRKQIEEEIAAAEAAKQKQIFNASADGGEVVKAFGFLGAGAAALGLIITAPLAGMSGGSPAPPPAAKTAPVKTEKVVKAASTPAAITSAPKTIKPKVSKTLKQSGYDFEGVSAAPKPKAAPAPAKDDKAAAEKAAAEKAAAEKAAAEKAAAEKAAAEKAAAEKAAAEKAAAEKAAAEKAAAEKAAAEKAAAEKAAAEKAAAAKKAAPAPAPKPEPAPAPKPAPAPPKPAPAPPKPAPAPPAPTPAPKTAAKGLGVVEGGEKGGKILEAETVSDDVKAFLKKYN